ncbi:hypothetical protein AB7M71_001499 [Bradyrhizobium japonicum]
MRGGHETQHAVRADQDGRAAELSDASSSAICSSASRLPSSIQSAPILPSSGLSPPSGAGVSSSCWKSWPIQLIPRVSCGSRQPIAGPEGPNPGVRPTHHRLASIKCDEQTAGRYPGRRAGAGNSAGRERCGCQRLPIGTGLLGLGWARAEAELERGQGQAWQYQQARRSLFAQPVHGRRTRRDPLC